MKNVFSWMRSPRMLILMGALAATFALPVPASMAGETSFEKQVSQIVRIFPNAKLIDCKTLKAEQIDLCNSTQRLAGYLSWLFVFNLNEFPIAGRIETDLSAFKDIYNERTGNTSEPIFIQEYTTLSKCFRGSCKAYFANSDLELAEMADQWDSANLALKCIAQSLQSEEKNAQWLSKLFTNAVRLQHSQISLCPPISDEAFSIIQRSRI